MKLVYVFTFLMFSQLAQAEYTATKMIKTVELDKAELNVGRIGSTAMAQTLELVRTADTPAKVDIKVRYDRIDSRGGCRASLPVVSSENPGGICLRRDIPGASEVGGTLRIDFSKAQKLNPGESETILVPFRYKSSGNLQIATSRVEVKNRPHYKVKGGGRFSQLDLSLEAR